MRVAAFRAIVSGLMLAALLGAGGCTTAPRGIGVSHGIANFARVNEGLYRGAQPDASGMEALKALGVKTIVNLRSSEQAGEEGEARRLGLNYVAIPMKGLREPSSIVVREALRAIGAGPGPVYVHCRYGCERTGTVIACYRIAHDQWNSEQALREARSYGMANWAVAMRRCVRRFERARFGPPQASYRTKANVRYLDPGPFFVFDFEPTPSTNSAEKAIIYA